MGERIISVANFEDGEEYREINSPRTMEACLRCGVDPSELYPVEKESLRRKGMTLDMLELKFSNSERKRRMKIDDVKSERLAIIKFSERPSQSPTKVDMMPQKDTSEGLIEQVRCPITPYPFMPLVHHPKPPLTPSLLDLRPFHSILSGGETHGGSKKTPGGGIREDYGARGSNGRAVPEDCACRGRGAQEA